MKKFLLWQDPSTQQLVQESLEKNHVLITSTDTTLGLLAALRQPAFDALNSIKGGRQDKPYLLLIGSPDAIHRFVDPVCLVPQVSEIIQHFWPGPLTIIFKAKPELPPFLVSADGTIALRCPHHRGLLELLKHYEGLFSTSANMSGEPVAQIIADIHPDVVSSIDYMVADDIDSQHTSQPSTIIDVSCPGKVKVIRQGAISIKEVQEFLER